MKTLTALLVVCAVAASPAAVRSQQPTPPLARVVLAPVASLEKMLPAIDGWTRQRVNSDRIDLADNCAYTYADAMYVNGAMKARVTLADTGADPTALAVVATMVVTLADGYENFLDGRTMIRRFAFNGSPAASRWDTKALDGEFTVVLDHRFIAKAEGSGMENVDVLRALLAPVNLQALAALK
jgi:hypothetical protein